MFLLCFMLSILGACGTALWAQAEVGAGAAVTAMTLRVSNHAHWGMWEMAALFETQAPYRTASTWPECSVIILAA